MGTIRKVYSSWTAMMFVMTSLAIYWGSYFWPPVSNWYELRALHVEDARVGEPIIIHIDRTIHKEFIGEFDVIVRRLVPDGWESVCVGGAGGQLRPDMVLPKPATLGWWTGGNCESLDQPGSYVVTTTATVLPGLHLRRTLIHESNIFKVTK